MTLKINQDLALQLQESTASLSKAQVISTKHPIEQPAPFPE